MANIVDDMTRRLLIDAGITAGMRVLDVGCGRGDVSLMISRLVGEQGQVLGVDRDVSPIAAARERARELGLSNVAFAEGDLGEPSPEHGLFDAAVGRRVLMYQRDPVVALRGLARAVRPGGLVVFQENDASIGPVSSKPLPLHERVRGWLWRTVEREGANIHMGFDLASVLERAGLTVEHVRAEAIVQTPRSLFPTGLIVRAMLARIAQQGVASAEEIEVDTLEQRLAEELQEANATYVGEMVFGAWARKPA